MVDVPVANGFESAIDCVAWWGVAQGVGKQLYKPSAPVNRGEMALFLTRVISLTGGTLQPASKDYFSDDDGTAFNAADNALAEAGVVSGVGNGKYAPLEAVTRGQMAKFLVKSYEYRARNTLPTGGPYFDDVTPATPFADFINTAATAQFAAGYADGQYHQDQKVTRDQMAAFLTRVLEKTVTDAGATVPAAPAARAALAAYVADDTKLYLRDLAAGTETLLYTAPGGSTITATSVAPDGSSVLFAQTTPSSSGSSVVTVVESVPAAGGTPSNADPSGVLKPYIVDHISWGAQVVASVFGIDRPDAMFLLDPAKQSAAQKIPGSLSTDCTSVDSLARTGLLLFSGCTSGVVLGDASGSSFGIINSAADVDFAVPSPNGQQIAFARSEYNSTDDYLGDDLLVAPSVGGTGKVVAHLVDATGAQPWVVNELAWQDPATLLYTADQFDNNTGDQVSPSQVYSVSAAGGATPQAVTGWSGADQVALSARPAVS